MKFITSAFLVVLFLFASVPLSIHLSAPASAEEKSKEDIEKEISKETPITEWLDSENALLDRLPKANRDVFFVFRNKHGIIRSIEVVHRDIKNAVKACGKANKEMKSAMNDRLIQWENAVFPILKDAKGLLKQELKEQEAFYISDYKHIMKLNDKAFSFSESKIEKSPVTTAKACEVLLNSMDRTEDKLISLLQNILLPEEVVRNRLKREG